MDPAVFGHPSRLLGSAFLGVLALAGVGCGGRSEPGRIEGRVLWQGEPVAAAMVGAYPKPEQDASTPPIAEAATGSDGRFQLELGPGRYWVWARATLPASGRSSRLVGQATVNPVSVAAASATRVEVRLADPSSFAAAAGPRGTGVTGRVRGLEAVRGGKTLVAAYPGDRERPGGPGFVAARPPGPDGGFEFDLPPGTYTLAARWRASGDDFGELAPGDRVATATVVVRAGDYADAGVLELRGLDPALRRTRTPGSPRSATALAGRVVDPEGRPVAGIKVLAFLDSRMAGKPLALSAPTGRDGTFVVPVPGRGNYFLGARARLGGPAEPGERVGSYRGETGAGVEASEGKVRGGIEILVEEVW